MSVCAKYFIAERREKWKKKVLEVFIHNILIARGNLCISDGRSIDDRSAGNICHDSVRTSHRWLTRINRLLPLWSGDRLKINITRPEEYYLRCTRTWNENSPLVRLSEGEISGSKRGGYSRLLPLGILISSLPPTRLKCVLLSIFPARSISKVGTLRNFHCHTARRPRYRFRSRIREK